MAKAQTIKPKSSLADWFKRFTGSKQKPAARPGPATQASTMTNLPAANASRSAHGAKAAAAKKTPAKDSESGFSLASFRVPFMGGMPITTQMQILGSAAAVLLVLTAALVYQDTSVRTRNATFISIASQMQFHTQRLAKAAGLAARGQLAAFPQMQDSREQFEGYLKVLRSGGVALGVTLPSAEGSPGITSQIEELWKRWPESSNAATAILAARNDLVALAQNVAEVRIGAEDMANESQELTGLMQQSGIAPAQVLRANRITFLSERLGRGAAEILGSEVIDPEVPFLIGKDTNDLRSLLQALESGNEAMGMSALKDA